MMLKSTFFQSDQTSRSQEGSSKYAFVLKLFYEILEILCWKSNNQYDLIKSRFIIIKWKSRASINAEYFTFGSQSELFYNFTII